jgi:hypothetical protein
LSHTQIRIHNCGCHLFGEHPPEYYCEYSDGYLCDTVVTNLKSKGMHK